MILKSFQILIFLLSLQGALFAESLYKVDFSKAPDGNGKRWLKLSNFALQQDAKEMKGLRMKGGKLIVATDAGFLGGMTLRRDIPGAKRVEVVWGVNQFPQGANWDDGNKREAVMLVVVFGKEMLDSSSWLLPQIPYFMGAFLGEKEKPGVWRKGKYYVKGGSYTCSPCNPKPGAMVTTSLELPVNFKAQFRKTMPEVIGFGFEFDTRNTQSGAEVMIQSVEFFDE